MSEPMPLLRREASFPKTLPEFANKFVDEAACAEILRRWKYGQGGFRCPRCGCTGRATTQVARPVRTLSPR